MEIKKSKSEAEGDSDIGNISASTVDPNATTASAGDPNATTSGSANGIVYEYV